jgi:FkbM family methyltransferase
LSTIYFKEQCTDAELIAFEPDTKNFELLSKNIASLNLTNISIRKEAVWIDDTEIDFSDDGTMGSKIN